MAGVQLVIRVERRDVWRYVLPSSEKVSPAVERSIYETDLLGIDERPVNHREVGVLFDTSICHA